MTADLGRRLSRHFGPQGLRHVSADEVDGIELPEEVRHALLDAGLPLQVGPYFHATQGEPLALGEFAASVGAPDVPPEMEQWCRLGTDQGAEICIDPAGAIVLVFSAGERPPVPVNTGLAAFLECLLALDQWLPVLRAPGEQDAAAVFRALRSRLLEIDGAAMEDDEAWWPCVQELIRHALSFPASVAFEVEQPDGSRRIETEETRVGVQHPEHLLWARLAGQGIRPGQVTRVYTELQPCMLPGNYCARFLRRFTNAEFTYGHDYGDTAQERENGLLELMTKVAEQI